MGLYEGPMDEDPSEEIFGDLLGGDVFVEGFDPTDEDDELPVADGEDPSSQEDEAIDGWAENKGEGNCRLTGRGWNTLPFGEPGKCEGRLFVDVRRSKDIARRLADTLAHLKICSDTRYVVFHVGGDIGYLEWTDALRLALHELRKAASHAKFVTRLAWNWTPRLGQRPYRWGGGICHGNTDNGKPIKLKACDRASFKHRIWLLEELGLLALDCAYIDHYTDQPLQPANGVSAVTFGSVKRNGIVAANSWRARIYLPGTARAADPDLGFHSMLLRNPLLVPVQAIRDAWIADRWHTFIRRPYYWIDQSHLANCRP